MKLKYLRTKIGLSKYEFAEAVGINIGAYSKYESGKLKIPVDVVHNLCLVLGVTPNKMFGFEDKEYSKSDMLNLIQSLKDYTSESHNILGHDDREPEEFFEIWKQTKK